MENKCDNGIYKIHKLFRFGRKIKIYYILSMNKKNRNTLEAKL